MLAVDLEIVNFYIYTDPIQGKQSKTIQKST